MLIYIYYFILITLPVFYIRQRYRFIYTLFILNIIAIIFRNYYEQGAYIFTLKSAIYFIFLFTVLKITHWKKHPFLSFYIIYLVMLLTLSTYFLRSLFGIIETVIIWGSFVLAYEFFLSKESLKNLLYVVILSNILFISYVLLLSTGIIELHNEDVGSGYGIIKTGAFSTAGINVIVIAVSITPFLLYLKPKRLIRRILLASSFVSAIIILLNFKRTSIAVMIISLGIYFLLTKRIKGVFNFVFLGVIMTMFIFVFLGNILQVQIASRYYIFETEHYIEGESRLKEFDIVQMEMENRPIINQLFGKNLFVTGDIWLKYFGYKRIFHNDWTALLATTGIIGLIFFIYLYISIFIRLIRTKPHNRQLLLHRNISIGLMTGSIIWILFGGFYLFAHSSALMMFIVGSYLGQIGAYRKENYNDV